MEVWSRFFDVAEMYSLVKQYKTDIDKLWFIILHAMMIKITLLPTFLKHYTTNQT